MKINWQKTLLYIVLIVLAVLLLSSYINFRMQRIDNIYANDFKSKLITAISDESFYMKDLTAFEWDKMYVIRPYTSKTEMQKIIGIKWTTYNTYLGFLFEKTFFGEYPIDDDIFQKLVFVKDEKVILDITIQRVVADFTQIEQIISYGDDLLAMERTQRDWIIVTH